MTRAAGPRTVLDVTTFGATGDARVVVVLREDGASAVDPDEQVTVHHDVRIVAVLVQRAEVADPAAYGGETPGSSTVAALADIVDEQVVDPDAPIGLVGVGGAGEEAILLAIRLGERVDTLALVGVARPDSPLERHLGERVMADVTAATLVINGENDPDAAAEAASWHREHLPDARMEVVSGDAYGPDRRLSVTDVWDRVLEHTAPGTARR